jgi:hypothetical protein
LPFILYFFCSSANSFFLRAYTTFTSWYWSILISLEWIRIVKFRLRWVKTSLKKLVFKSLYLVYLLLLINFFMIYTLLDLSIKISLGTLLSSLVKGIFNHFSFLMIEYLSCSMTSLSTFILDLLKGLSVRKSYLTLLFTWNLSISRSCSKWTMTSTSCWLIHSICFISTFTVSHILITMPFLLINDFIIYSRILGWSGIYNFISKNYVWSISVI